MSEAEELKRPNKEDWVNKSPIKFLLEQDKYIDQLQSKLKESDQKNKMPSEEDAMKEANNESMQQFSDGRNKLAFEEGFLTCFNWIKSLNK